MGLDRGLNSSSTNPLGIDDDDYTATTRGAQGPKGDDGASTQDYIDKFNTVVTSAAAAVTSATNAASSNSQAAAQASTATTKAATATTKASEASTSASNAATSASTASTQATNSANSASAGSTSATNSANSATAAASSASTATTKSNQATASASTASTQATNSSNSATASANSATAAANSATAGANSATAAGNSASGASTSATNAASSLSTFQGIFYGALSSVPTSNIATGDLYFDTGNNAMKVYNGSAWQIIAPTVTTVDNSTWSGADLSVANGGTGASSDSAARTNLGLVIGTDVLAPDGDGSSLTGLNAVVVGSTLPSNGAAAGSLFYRTGDKKFFISDGSTWSLVNNSGPAPTGGTVVITSVAELSGSYSYNLGLNFTDDANTDAELTYALSSGAMPTGAVLPSSGSTSITGTIPAVSSDTLFSFQIRATDESALSSVQNYQWTILNSVPATTGGTVTISNVFESSAASYDVDANFTFSAGSVFSAFSLQSGTLPVGLSLNTSTGVISGTTNATKTTYNFTIRATAVDGGSSDQYYAWAVVTAPPVNGTGGLTFNKASGHREHRFVSSGTFQVSQGGNIEVLMVGGGGGGGANAYSGGGGGGGVYYNGAHVVSSNTNYTITIGAGGASQSQGQNTVAFGVTALGGGYGNENSFSYPQASQRPSVGGNGGGGGGNGGGTRLGAAGSLPAVAGWTRHGGNAGGNSSGGGHGGAGGGGAGAAGGNNLNTGASVGGGAVHGAGGAGHQDQGITGSNLYWAGGGGGGSHGGPAHHTSLGGNGGSGGGGGGNTTHGAARGNAAGGTGGMSNGNAGGTQTGSGFGDGGAHTGGGGGGGAGVGGSGIVILRYIS